MENIDKMVEKSQDLSRQSKQFYRKSKNLIVGADHVVFHNKIEPITHVHNK